MVSSFFKSEETRANNLANELLLDIWSPTTETAPDLETWLRPVCEGILKLPNILGAIVVAFDGQGLILTEISRGQEIDGRGQPHEWIDLLAARHRQTKTLSSALWQPIPNLEGTSDTQRVAKAIHLQGQRLGALIVELARPPEKMTVVLSALDQLMPHIALGISRILTRAESALLKDLQQLSVHHLTPNIPNTTDIVQQLKAVLKVGSVTLLVKEHERLFLSASTDEELSKARTSPYEPGTGLEGFVFNSGQTLHLLDASDEDEVSAKIQPIDRTRAFVGKDLCEGQEPILIVPLFSTGPWSHSSEDSMSGITDPINGVLRVVGSQKPFATFEREALEAFAVLLGTALARAWKNLIGDRLFHARTETFAVSRNDQGTPRLVDFDHAAVNFFGGTPEELRGMDVRKLYTDVGYKRLQKACEMAISDGSMEVPPMAITIRQLGGEHRTSTSSYRLLTSPFVAPETHYTLSLLRDTTKESRLIKKHERLVELLHEKRIAYFAADPDGMTIETSKTEACLIGIAEDELIGMNRKDLWADPKKLPPLIDIVNKEDGRLVFTVQKLSRQDGSRFEANGFLRLVKDEFGNRLGYEGLYEDASYKINLQRLLDLPTDKVIEDQVLFDKLEQSTALNLDYMTSLSHQIRTPLSALTHNLSDFRRRTTDTSLKRELDYLIGQTKVCDLLTENLSFIDRILRGDTFNKSWVNVARLAIETKIDFRHHLRDRGLQMSVDDAAIRKHFPSIQGHPGLLRQVLVNLTDNSIKYSPDRTEIRLTASRTKSSRVLEITNTGPHVSAEEKKRVFDRGFRSPLARALSGGTGLGLWITKKIVSLHGATIHCTSRPIEGSSLSLISFQIRFEGNE